MRKREKGVFAHVRVGPADDDCPLCNFEGTPAELTKLVKEMGGVVMTAEPEAAEVADDEGHWEEQRLGPGMWAKRWVRKKTGC